jgi:four helix bundle protein
VDRKQASVSIKSFRDLIVWQKAYELCLQTYKETRTFPKNEEFGLVSQPRRCVVSIPSNISDGYNRKSKKEYIHFLFIAHGSLGEYQTQIMIAKDIGYLDTGKYGYLQNISEEVGKMLWKMTESLSK